MGCLVIEVILLIRQKERMMAVQISAAVGKNAANQVDDVTLVQQLLLQNKIDIGTADGICGSHTIDGIILFQSGYLSHPDGRIDPGGRTFQALLANAQNGEAVADSASNAGLDITAAVSRSSLTNLNPGLISASNSFMIQKFGKPRDDMTNDCQPVTHPTLKTRMSTAAIVGEKKVKVTGLSNAVESLSAVMADIAAQQPAVYAALGTAGMLCCRLVRGSATSISNHSWGTAIDLTLNGKLDARGDNKVQYGLTLIAPIFNQHGWYWGAAFGTEDGMHFEAGKALLEQW
jgi:hypothetical protein